VTTPVDHDAIPDFQIRDAGTDGDDAPRSAITGVEREIPDGAFGVRQAHQVRPLRSRADDGLVVLQQNLIDLQLRYLERLKDGLPG
jgi:hypothetical protein